MIKTSVFKNDEIEYAKKWMNVYILWIFIYCLMWFEIICKFKLFEIKS